MTKKVILVYDGDAGIDKNTTIRNTLQAVENEISQGKRILILITIEEVQEL